MDIFDALTLVGGLCLFLFGMNIMGSALERSAGNKLENMIGKLTTGKMAGWLEKLAYKLIPDAKLPEKVSELDERLLTTPAIALECALNLTRDMAKVATDALIDSVACITSYDKSKAEAVREAEDKTDHLEDVIGSYLVKLSTKQLNETEGATASMLLKAIGDFERISDHAVNILESAEEMREKGIVFSNGAKTEMDALCAATLEIVNLSYGAFIEDNAEQANLVEPLEQVIDDLKETMRMHHIQRLQQGMCSIETGFVWSDLLTALERVGDHCSNIAGAIIDMAHHDMNTHAHLRALKTSGEVFMEKLKAYSNKYAI